MNVFKKISNFFSNILFKEEEKVDKEEVEQMLEELKEIENEENNKIKISKRTIIAKLYSLEQKISVLNPSFKDAYDIFSKEIEELRNSYIDELEESGKDLTFTIDPDINIKKLSEVSMLEERINKVIQVDLRFGKLKSSFEHLILKLNELYNVSIYVTGEENKVLMQLENGQTAQKRLIDELKSYEFILNNKEKMNVILSLILYSDFLIFKIKLKNSKGEIQDIKESLVSTKDFLGLDNYSTFKDYLLDELSDLRILLEKIQNVAVKRKLEKEIGNFETKIIYNDTKELFEDESIFEELFKIEKQTIDVLLSEGLEKDEAKIKVLDKFEIKTKQEELYVSPRTNAIISLSGIFNGTLQTKAMIALKILNNLTDNISYKEIYFILLLLNLLDVVKTEDDEFTSNILKYKRKYPYSNSQIKEKNRLLKNNGNSSYIFTFKVNDNEIKEVIKVLDNLELDYLLDNGNILFNEFYFKEMKNVLKDLKEISKNIK